MKYLTMGQAVPSNVLFEQLYALYEKSNSFMDLAKLIYHLY